MQRHSSDVDQRPTTSTGLIMTAKTWKVQFGPLLRQRYTRQRRIHVLYAHRIHRAKMPEKHCRVHKSSACIKYFMRDLILGVNRRAWPARPRSWGIGLRVINIKWLLCQGPPWISSPMTPVLMEIHATISCSEFLMPTNVSLTLYFDKNIPNRHITWLIYDLVEIFDHPVSCHTVHDGAVSAKFLASAPIHARLS